MSIPEGKGKPTRAHPDYRSGMKGTSASQARSSVPVPSVNLLALAKQMEEQTRAQHSMLDSLQQRDSSGGIPEGAKNPEELMAMAKQMEAQTAAQHAMGSSLQERDSAGGIMPEWLTRDAKKNGYGG